MNRFALSLSLLLLATLSFADSSKLNTAVIKRITGMTGTYSEKADVYKVSYPRKDLRVFPVTRGKRALRRIKI